MAYNVVKKISEQFIETLKRTSWMDVESREASIKKLNAIEFHLGANPKALMNDTLIDECYKDVELQTTDSYLFSMFRIQRFLDDQEIKKLRKPVNESDWINQLLDVSHHVTEISALYRPDSNSICMLAIFVSSLSFIISSFDCIY